MKNLMHKDKPKAKRILTSLTWFQNGSNIYLHVVKMALIKSNSDLDLLELPEETFTFTNSVFRNKMADSSIFPPSSILLNIVSCTISSTLWTSSYILLPCFCISEHTSASFVSARQEEAACSGRSSNRARNTMA